jgi:CubicO group peptidase (beta-lactamase class C family)
LRNHVSLLLSAATLCVSSFAWAAAPPLQRLDGVIEQGLKDWQTPGLVVAVVSKDQVALASGYGVRETGKPARLDGNSLVGIGSTSKAFGAAGIARLVETGKVGFEDRVEKYLPWFQLSDPWVTHEVRVRDILSHRVGLDLSDENRLLAVAEDSKDFVRRLRYIEPAEPFRSTYVYSNAMFTTTGLVIEAASGKRWDEFIRDEIWTPLGMSRTGANLDVALADANHATPHVLVDGKLRALPGWEPERNIFEVTGPSGAVISSAQDMAQWLRLQLGQGKYAGKQIIEQKIFQQMHTPHSPMRDVFGATSWFTHIPAADVKIGNQAYAMGWRTSSYRGRPMIWHGGTVTGFRTVVAMLPEEQVAVFVNGSRESLLPFAVALTVFDAYLGAKGEDWSKLFLKERAAQEADDAADASKRDAARTAGTRTSLPLDQYTGEYQDTGAFERLSVVREGDKLVVKLGARTGDLEHWHYDVFRVHWRAPSPSESFATFVVDSNGKAARLELARYGHFERRR